MDLSKAFKWFEAPSSTERLTYLHVRPDLVRAATDMVGDSRSDSAVQDFEQHLTESEKVIAIAQGRHHKHLGLLVLTSDRIIFSNGTPTPDIDLPLTDLALADTHTGSYSGELHLFTGTDHMTVDKLLGRENERFAAQIRRQMTNPAVIIPTDPLQRLAELRNLRDTGIITREEFDAEKQRLIKEI